MAKEDRSLVVDADEAKAVENKHQGEEFLKAIN